MKLPPIPDAAIDAMLSQAGIAEAGWEAERDWARGDLEAAWPHLYALALRDFVTRVERFAKHVDKTSGPEGYVFAVTVARTLADDAVSS